MKRILHSARFLAVAAALCLLGCTQESVPETERTWTVSAELSPVSTKVTVDTGYKLHWSKGDNVRLIALNPETSAEAKLTVYDVDAGLEKAMFKGEVTMASMPTDCIFAYPYNGTSVSGTSTTYSYTSQDYTLSPYLWGKAAYSTPEIDCALSHIGGTIHLTNIASNIVSVTLKGNNSEPIGQVVIDAKGTATVSGATEITVSTSGTGDAYINVPPVNFDKGFTIIAKAQNLSGKTQYQYRSFSTSGTADSGFDFTPANGVGKLIKIQWDDFTSFGITASATIAHTKDGSGYLNGSTVTLNSFTVTGAPSKIITEYGVDLYKGTPESGTLVRTLTQSTSPAANTTLTDAGTGWPYLPKSNTTYTLRPWCKIHGGEPLYGTPTTLYSPAPEFEVKVSAYTSYDKYLESDISTANACTAETIYNVSASAKISTSILENSNYADLKNAITYTYTVDNGTLAESSEPGKYTVTGCARGEHIVTAECTFDGASNSGERKCIITGLPYTIAPDKNEWRDVRKSPYLSYETGSIVMNGSNTSQAPLIESKHFFIPNNTNIRTTFNYKIRSYKGLSKYWSVFYQFIGGTNVYEYTKDSNGEATYNNTVTTGQLTGAKPYIEFEARNRYMYNPNAYCTLYETKVEYVN